jgi:hypothetical protein
LSVAISGGHELRLQLFREPATLTQPGRLEKAALKARALQALVRSPITLSKSQSVWSASDLSALSAWGGSTGNSWPRCASGLELKSSKNSS